MKRITTVLKESEAMTVRKAVCLAGGEHIVITPIPYRMCGVDAVDLFNEKIIAGSYRQVKIDVTTDDSLAGGVIAVIRRIAHAGRIDLAFFQDRQPKPVA
jgi:nitrogen regulatory protein PII